MAKSEILPSGLGLVGYLGGDKGAGLSRDLSNLKGVVPEPATDPRPKMLMSHHGASILDSLWNQPAVDPVGINVFIEKKKKKLNISGRAQFKPTLLKIQL